MILPSQGGRGLDCDAMGFGLEDSYFALQPSTLSSPSSDEYVGGQFLGEPSLEHNPDASCSSLFYYYWHKPYRTRKRWIIGGFVVAGALLTIIVASSLYGSSHGTKKIGELVPPDPEQPPPPSASKPRAFKRAAVCADGPPCAFIGKSMLDRNGSAVDAAIASLICNGIINMQSMGLGGGFLMTIYERQNNRIYVLNAREAAPAAAYAHMYEDKPKFSSRVGGLSIAVPGELAGYWEAHQRFGKIPWADLFYPSIDLCEKGYNMTKHQWNSLGYNKTNIYSDPTLKEMFVDPKTGQFRKVGSLIRPKKLCETLKIIAEQNATAFYNGTLGKYLVEDIRKRGSIITMKDLNDYRAKWEDPASTELYGGHKVHSVGVPGGGALLAFILNVLDEFHLQPSDIADTNSTIKTYHKIIETFKYAFGLRTKLGDVEMPKFQKNITSKNFAHSIQRWISDEKTYGDASHYGAENSGNGEDHGTAHIAVMSENGDAVSVTSTVNIYFASGIVSERTGVLLNDAMDDFGLPGILSYFGLPSNENNHIAPGKRPLSSMSPAIVLDRNGDVKMTVGAAGGTKIPTSLALVIARYLWLGNTIKEAVDAPRIHHQLYPMQLFYEYGVPKAIVEGLKAIGHNVTRYRDRGSVVCILTRINGTIYGNADYRKGGDVYGIN
ncbi:hypothetical protein TKK_0012205 [Trichogramma kaykai]|uniref:Gamma-glutamyltransferase n=1 Tax=Trichogramma kaykai TaxID=54128 RepID=A0ABD2WMF4_9HYME